MTLATVALACMLSDMLQIGATPPKDPREADIVVSAKRAIEEQLIDRRVYIPPNSPATIAADGFTLLRGLPAVTVSLDDKVQLLGTPNVTILINGKRAPDSAAALRGLHGGDVERIEVMTTPSAEYSAEGTGGIINIVLKRKRDAGTSTSTVSQVDSFGGFEIIGTNKQKGEVFSFDTQAVARRLVFKGSGRAVRQVRLTPDSEFTGNASSSDYDGETYVGILSETIGYKIDDDNTATVSGAFGINRGSTRNRANFLGLTPDFQSFGFAQQSESDYDFSSLDFSFKRVSHQQSDVKDSSLTFSASANWVSQPQASTAYILGIGEDSTRYQLADRRYKRDTLLKVDYVLPMSEDRVQSLGASYASLSLDRTQAFLGSDGLERLGSNYRYDSQYNRKVFAAYANIQRSVLGWTLLPAIRLEYAVLDRSVDAYHTFSSDKIQVFPSFHLSKTIGDYSKLVLSYAKRLDRPSLEQLYPFTVVSSITNASVGNPYLEDQVIDSFEANLSYKRSGMGASAIFYRRMTDNAWTSFYSSTPTGLVLVQLVNFDRRIDSGFQFDLSTPSAFNTKFVGSINLFNSNVPLYTNSNVAHDGIFRTTANATVEWTRPPNGRSTSDNLQLQFNYQTRRREFQTTFNAQLVSGLSYSHGFSNSLSLVITAENLLGNRKIVSRVSSPQANELTISRVIGPRIFLKILKSFGR